jgi:hypothetical protein
MKNRHIFGFLILLIFYGINLTANAAMLENEGPNGESVNVVKVIDYNGTAGSEFQPFYLLLTNNTGYKIECSEANTLSNMLQGLGLDASAISTVSQFDIYSDSVVDSDYETNASLNCVRSNEDLHVIEYPEGEPKYLIDFNDATSLNMVGCQDLLHTMGFDVNEAEAISETDAQQYYDVSDERDIHCISTAAPEACFASSCGDHPHLSSWEETIFNGIQSYTCNNGVTYSVGIPACDNRHEMDSISGDCIPKSCGDYLHRESWNELIPFGSTPSLCYFGNEYQTDYPVCHQGFSRRENQCQDLSCDGHANGSNWTEYIVSGSHIPIGERGYYCESGEALSGPPSCYHGSSNGTCLPAP